MISEMEIKCVELAMACLSECAALYLLYRDSKAPWKFSQRTVWFRAKAWTPDIPNTKQ